MTQALRQTPEPIGTALHHAALREVFQDTAVITVQDVTHPRFLWVFPGNSHYKDSKEQRNIALNKISWIADNRHIFNGDGHELSFGMGSHFTKGNLAFGKNGRSRTLYVLEINDAHAHQALWAALQSEKVSANIRHIAIKPDQLQALSGVLQSYAMEPGERRAHYFQNRVISLSRANSFESNGDVDDSKPTVAKIHTKQNQNGLPPKKKEVVVPPWRNRLVSMQDDLSQAMFELREGGLLSLRANEKNTHQVNQFKNGAFIARLTDLPCANNAFVLAIKKQNDLITVTDLIQFACGLTNEEVKKLYPVKHHRHFQLDKYHFLPLTDDWAEALQEIYQIPCISESPVAFDACLATLKKRSVSNGRKSNDR